MKSYTDLEQSKILAKILPFESADMRYSPLGDNMHPWIWTDTFIEKNAVPCWSLAALLDVLPKTLEDGFYDEYELNINMIDKKPEYIGLDNQVHSDFPYNFNNKELLDNIVKAIIWLHEQNLL